ncbi:MAG: hypothetical protein R2798_02510 [Chitinophagales bacterium]|nr:hypothetical protein [Bacteroidota bacterium]MCB9042200.1 hypothetical protein [Chitinophagales bacterium]
MHLTQKKYLLGNNQPPHVGNLIKRILQTRAMNKSVLARQLNVTAGVVHTYVKKNSLQLTIVWRISNILGYNFLIHLGEQVPVDYTTQKEKALQAKIDALQAEHQKLQSENQLLRDLVRAR